jgi:hypothetical protein
MLIAWWSGLSTSAHVPDEFYFETVTVNVHAILGQGREIDGLETLLDFFLVKTEMSRSILKYDYKIRMFKMKSGSGYGYAQTTSVKGGYAWVNGAQSHDQLCCLPSCLHLCKDIVLLYQQVWDKRK